LKGVANKKEFPKKRELEDCYQNLYQAEAKGDKHQIMIWKAIIAKLESRDDVKNKNRSRSNPPK
jgi:hypothetical protein